MIAPGEASPVWMRGWKAGLKAAWMLLIERSRTGILNVNELDLRAETEGLLDPEPRDGETQTLHLQERVLLARIATIQACLNVATHERDVAVEERDHNAEVAYGLAERVNRELQDYVAYARAVDELISS